MIFRVIRKGAWDYSFAIFVCKGEVLLSIPVANVMCLYFNMQGDVILENLLV